MKRGVAAGYGSGDATAELWAGDVFRHLPNEVGNSQHGIASVRVTPTVSKVGLAGTSVNDGNEVVSDDDAVFAFLFRVLGDNCLFDDLHGVWRCCRTSV